MNNKYTFEDFKEIIAALRSENGCPWDREQTHESLRPCMTEEAAELLSAIRIYMQTGSAENMREELGDILLQVMLHSQIADEEGLFTIEDVIQEISEKMVRRHPHVFADASAHTSEQVLQNWDEIKKKEKEGKAWIPSPLQEIPKEFPSLIRAPKVLKKVDKLYEPQHGYTEAVAALTEGAEALIQLSADTDKTEIEKVLGDMLLEIAQLGRLCRLPLEQIFTDKIEDIVEKYEGNGQNSVK